MTKIYEAILRPLFFTLSQETLHQAMHHFCVLFGRSTAFRAFLQQSLVVDDPRLQLRVAGIDFPNPVGLAAGFDKTGEMVDVVSRVGFGHVEVGSVTYHPWAGNPKPQLFRLVKDEAIINRMGLNNPGARVVAACLPQRAPAVPVGISVAKTPDPKVLGEDGVQEFVSGVMALYDCADYLALNISCPNTPEGKTFEDPSLFESLLHGIRQREESMPAERTPIFVKLSPDTSDEALTTLLELCRSHDIDGVIIGNTTTCRQHLRTSPERIDVIGRGGLSGAPLRERALAFVGKVYRKTQGKLPIIGCGGIATAEDAYRFLRAGASLVQLYTAMIYHGPWIMRDINQGLLRLLAADGHSAISEVIGIDQQ